VLTSTVQARNEEKANSMLNKWVTMKEGMARGDGGYAVALVDVVVHFMSDVLLPCHVLRTVCVRACVFAYSRRPFLASECDDLTAALRWRREILREMARKINEIQNGRHSSRGGTSCWAAELMWWCMQLGSGNTGCAT